MSPDQITVQELAEKLERNEPVFILDVRNPDEYTAYNIGGTLIPLPELSQRLNEIPKDKPIVVHCRSGHRSEIAQVLLQSSGFRNVKNLIGGVLAWEQEVQAK